MWARRFAHPEPPIIKGVPPPERVVRVLPFTFNRKRWFQFYLTRTGGPPDGFRLKSLNKRDNNALTRVNFSSIVSVLVH